MYIENRLFSYTYPWAIWFTLYHNWHFLNFFFTFRTFHSETGQIRTDTYFRDREVLFQLSYDPEHLCLLCIYSKNFLHVSGFIFVKFSVSFGAIFFTNISVILLLTHLYNSTYAGIFAFLASLFVIAHFLLAPVRCACSINNNGSLHDLHTSTASISINAIPSYCLCHSEYGSPVL